MICDAQTRILTVNPAFETLTGYREAEVIGHTPALLQSHRQDRSFYKDMWRSISATGSWRGEICNRRKGGELYVEWLTIRAIYDSDKNVTHCIGILSDVSDRKSVEADARHETEFDSLTELPNRTLLVGRLYQLMKSAAQSGEKLTILFIDLDRFNDINQSMGHDAGDLVLQSVARRISAVVSHSGFVARLSADEFCVLIPELLNASDAAKSADIILDAIRVPVTIKGQELSVSASIGVAMFPHDGADPEELLRNAHAAMSKVKREQRNGYQFYALEMNHWAAERLRTENDLRLAVERHELVLHYQPQIDLVSGAVIGRRGSGALEQAWARVGYAVGFHRRRRGIRSHPVHGQLGAHRGLASGAGLERGRGRPDHRGHQHQRHRVSAARLRRSHRATAASERHRAVAA